jgi:hypothetical protein
MLSAMRNRAFSFFFLSLIGSPAAYAGSSKNGSLQVHPFKVDLGGDVPRMLDLIKHTRLPEKPEYPGVGASFGMDLDVLKTLQNEWLHKYSWQKDELYINRYVI